MSRAGGVRTLRRAGTAQVTNVELFFDLVYVFAVTQLSHVLVEHTTAHGAVQALILLAIVWQVWVYTTWVTNWIDPDRLPTRAMLLIVMVIGLALSAAIPEAFEHESRAAWVVAGAYAGIQIGRSVFAVLALHDEPNLRRNFQRILAWCVVSGAAMLVGAAAHGHVREAIWGAAILFDFLGGRAGFWTPGLGRSTTDDWDIEGSHFAERCEAFVIIALGESIVVIGSTLSHLDHITGSVVLAFVAAFAGSAALWWVYFDRIAEHGAKAISEADDPGRIGATAYHLVHPVIVAGVIVGAAADQLVLEEPTHVGHMPTAWLLLGGTALFLAGHGLFKFLVFDIVPVPRIIAVAVLAALLLVAAHLSALVLSALVVAVVASVAVSDRVLHPPVAD